MSDVLKPRTQKLRLALLVDSCRVSSWAFRMVSLLVESKNAEVVLVVVNESPGHPSRDGARRRYEHILYRLHRKLDKMLDRSSQDPFQPQDLRTLLPDAEFLSTTPDKTKFSDTIQAGVCQHIRSLEIDIGVRLGFRILKGEILECTNYGIWSYHHGDNRVNRGGPPGFWEVMEGEPLTGVTLQVLSKELDAGETLSRTFSTTDPTLVSRNKRTLYWNSAVLLPRAVDRLARLGPTEFFERLEDESGLPHFYTRRLYRPPTNRQLIKALGSHALRAIRRKLAQISSDRKWALLYCYRSSGALSTSMRQYEMLKPPSDREWADPFPVVHDGTHYVFFEDLAKATGKAQISWMRYEPGVGFSDPAPALVRDYHLSYPFVFQHESEFYMIPETAQNGTVELYRARRFPHDWELTKVLMSGVRARDTTLLYQRGKWWMFTCLQEYEGMSSWQELFLFWSDDLLSEHWTPHPMNPVVSDAGSARPAGAFLRLGQKLYRPSQDCGKHYGRAVKLNEVTEMSEQGYSETCVQEIRPEWEDKIERVHTLNFCQGLSMADALISETKIGW